MIAHLVDGTYELFRAYFGAPSRLNSVGKQIGATWALARTLLRFIENYQVSHIAIAFDHVIESFRNDLFDGYKTGEGIPSELLAQFDLAEQVARSLGITCWPMIEFEADDALASAAKQLEPFSEFQQIRLCSPDKDLCQSVRGERIVCWDRHRDIVLDESGVWRKFGVAPLSIPDYLALVGDAADGVPGIPRWGAKAAATLLGHYGRIEHIPLDSEGWAVSPRGKKALAEQLRQNADAALLYRRLTTLDENVPLAASPELLEWKGPSFPELDALAAILGDSELPARGRLVSERVADRSPNLR